MDGLQRAFDRSLSMFFGNIRRAGPPRFDLLFWTRADRVDTIGLSISAIYAAVPVEHRSIYSANGVDWYDWPTIITNIEASVFLNNGGELAGNATKGYVQYIDGTYPAILRLAYGYLGETYPEIEQAVNPDLSQAYNPDDSSMYNPA